MRGRSWLTLLDDYPTVTTNFPEKPGNPIYGSKDVTKQWKESANPNSHEIVDAKRVIQDGVTYTENGKNVRLDYSRHEKDVAELLEGTYGGELYMIPKISSKYKNVQTPDFLFRGERYDLKDIGKANADAIYNAIHTKRKQADSFVLDVTESEMSDDDAIRRGILILSSLLLKHGLWKKSFLQEVEK